MTGYQERLQSKLSWSPTLKNSILINYVRKKNRNENIVENGKREER